MRPLIVPAIVILIVVMIVRKVKKEKEWKEYQQKRKAELDALYSERKKNGEPSVCERVPKSKEGSAVNMITGPDGKEYPDDPNCYETAMLLNYSYKEENRYSFSPVYIMLATENFEIPEYIKKLENSTISLLGKDIEHIARLADNYAYPVADRDDMMQSEYYTLRHNADWREAMEDNGYYRNAYGFDIDGDKALLYYELQDGLREKYNSKYNGIDTKHIEVLVQCWLQAAHLYATGRHGAQQNVEMAKKRYAQAYQMAQHLNLNDVAMDVIHAMTSGYPRDPAVYENQAHNMLADWACNTDLGLAMYVEYILYGSELDKARLAQSPEEAFRVYLEQASENPYAGYQLGRALLYGYGTAQNETVGKQALEVAASARCVSAIYLLRQLARGNRTEVLKWKDALDNVTETVAARYGFMRDVLKGTGMSVTEQQLERVRSEMMEEALASYSEAISESSESKLSLFADDNGVGALPETMYRRSANGELVTYIRTNIAGNWASYTSSEGTVEIRWASKSIRGANTNCGEFEF